MNLSDKVIAVTGGGSGIGAELCARFAREGARAVVVIDLDEAKASSIATTLNGVGIGCDVTKELDLVATIDQIETNLGPIDLFCSNAGVLLNDPDPNDPASASDSAWETSWQLHVMSHVYAARRLAPAMAGRGGGYFLNTISAAGLLTQLGSAPYSTTKHAAVGFAESLAIAYADRSVKVSILCPQGVATPMVSAAANTPAVFDGLLSPSQVADAVVEGLGDERFLILPHAQVLGYMQRKAADYDRWLRGLARLRSKSVEGVHDADE